MTETHLHDLALSTCVMLPHWFLSSHFARDGQTEVDASFHVRQSAGSDALRASHSPTGQDMLEFSRLPSGFANLKYTSTNKD